MSTADAPLSMIAASTARSSLARGFAASDTPLVGGFSGHAASISIAIGRHDAVCRPLSRSWCRACFAAEKSAGFYRRHSSHVGDGAGFCRPRCHRTVCCWHGITSAVSTA